VENVTVALDDDIALWVRTEAERRQTTVSRLVRDLLRDQMRQERGYELAGRRFMARPAPSLNATGARRPSRDEAHDR